MSDSLSGYSLRRGYSPHRNSFRRRSSKTCHRKGNPEEAQEEIDSIFVATYNDNPKHLYGKKGISILSYSHLIIEQFLFIIINYQICQNLNPDL